MSEQDATQSTATVDGQAEAPKPEAPKPTETVDFWKQKAREQETRAKANAEAATRLKEFEDRDKTESQRLAERAEAAEKRVLDAESRALRLEVASEKGLTPAQAKRLVGATREELEADATELLTTFKPAEDATVTAATASLDLGNHGTAAATQAGPAADFAKFLNGQTGR